MRKIKSLIILILFMSGGVFAQGKPLAQPQGKPQAQPQKQPQVQPQAKPAAPKVDEKGVKKQEDQDQADKATDLALELKLMGGLGIPLGSISTLGADLGGGGHFDVELRLPFSLGPLQLKLGLTGGFYGFGMQPDITTLNTSITLIPVLGYAVLAFPVKTIGLTPYISIGGGGTITGYQIVDTTQTANTFDGTLAFRLGAEYSLPPVPKLSIVLNAGYMIIFEADNEGVPNNGQLLNIELGISYRILGK